MGGSGTELQGPRCKAQSVPGSSRSVGVGAPRCLHCSQLLPQAAETLPTALTALPSTAHRQTANGPALSLLRSEMSQLKHTLPHSSVLWPEPAVHRDSGAKGQHCRVAGVQDAQAMPWTS